eukprot:TRINITY_DN1916_c0_g1_i3.p1 TRINITY_DN1916_c0_g1~~TRINITY_DN1916_c0_g1_i3.p1  ORF type:complete len:243 (-),score=35.62 TRINITY_DN1916_c0_g1_i3:592-1320(-)
MAAASAQLVGHAASAALSTTLFAQRRSALSNHVAVVKHVPGFRRSSRDVKRGSILCEAQGTDKAKKELQEMADKVSEKADEISKGVAKSTEDLKQASPSTPEVPPDLESVGLGPDKVPSGPYSFREVFSFTGLAPEITNGRIAMLSYLSVITLEYVTGKGIVEQLSTGGWVPAVALSTLIVIGSVVPLFRGYTNDDWPGIGPFTAKAERWNSRAAMVAFALLVTVELVKGGPEIVQGGPIGF